MSIYINHFDQPLKVKHLSAHGEEIAVGALVTLATTYKYDFERYRTQSLTGRNYRVLGIEAVPSSHRERLGIERDRAANLEIAAGKERWYAAVSLAAVLTDEQGALVRIEKSPCETFLERYLRCSVPADVLRVVEPGTGKKPVGDIDYSISPYEHLFPKYEALDHTYEGWSNRPSACLALFLLNDQRLLNLLRQSRTAKGNLSPAKLKQLSVREDWIRIAVPDDAYFTDPFPSFMPFRQEVNFEEIAWELTAKFKAESI